MRHDPSPRTAASLRDRSKPVVTALRPLGDEPVRVAYIAGYGHSGSTLLNIALGQHPDVMGAGELFRLADAWQGNEFCSCGQPLPQCTVWREIVDRWTLIVGGDPIQTYRRLQRTSERWLRGTDWADFASYSQALFAAIRDVTGRALIVDASKLPRRAAALARVPGIDLRLLHLVRDGRGVAWSLRRRLAQDPRAGLQTEKRQRSVVRTGLLWMASNLAVEHAARRLPPGNTRRIAYEAVVSDPQSAFMELGELYGLDLSAVADGLVAQEPLKSGHVMAGNRLRMNGSVRLRPDFEWQRKLPVRQQWLLGQLCRPILRRYGYLGIPVR